LGIFSLTAIYFLGVIDDSLIILGVMILLAEPHFAIGWPWIVSKKFGNIYSENKFGLLLVPILIVLSSLFIVWQFGLLTFSYLFLLANIYHVNRQSLGIWKILGLPRELHKNADIDIHTISLIYLFSHFYFNSLGNNNLRMLGAVVILAIIGIYFVLRYRLFRRDLQLKCGALQAVSIFAPLMFIEQPLLAMALGVSVHYIQYLILAGGVALYELNRFKIFIFVFTYVLIMTLCQTWLKDYSSWLILIASIPQLLHFYLDGFFWRFSNPVIKTRFFNAFKGRA
jgi:hypothetical protein